MNISLVLAPIGSRYCWEGASSSSSRSRSFLEININMYIYICYYYLYLRSVAQVSLLLFYVFFIAIADNVFVCIDIENATVIFSA